MQNAHQVVFKDLLDRVVVTATADFDIDRARYAADFLGAEHFFTDYRELFPYVDACLIATPHHLHHEMGMSALRAGKDVLMEKPMAISEEECLDLIETKYLGEVFHISIYTEQLTQPPPNHWIRSAEKLGGGQFFSHGCHYIDLLLWFLGNPIKGVHLGTRKGTPWMEKEGTPSSRGSGWHSLTGC